MHEKKAVATLTAAEGLKELQAGNRRYVAGTPVHPRQDASRRNELATGQRPFAIVLACSDSRVPVELVFDCGIGDLFVIRTAGHMLDEAVLASAQYAAEHLGTPLMVVLGHSNCGAIKSVVEGAAAEGHLGRALAKLQPLVNAAAARSGDIMDAAVTVNIENAVNTLKSQPWVKELKIAGLRYDLRSGQVTTVC